jgi:hypothetical protein
VYCPNCGTKQKSPPAALCAKCQMPLEATAGLVEAYRATLPPPAETPGVSRDRLIGAAAFLAIAAVPLGVGVKNSLTKKP